MTIDEAIECLMKTKSDALAAGNIELVVDIGGEEKSITEFKYVAADVIFYPGRETEANRCVIKV